MFRSPPPSPRRRPGRWRCFPAAAVLLAAIPFTSAAPTLPHILGDHMVLQAGRRVPLWGWAEPGEPLTIRFANQEIHTNANAQGRWQTELEPLTPDGNAHDLVVAGSGTVTVTDVLIGENWLCSGQSNMEKPLGERRGQLPVFNFEQEIREADFPLLRLFKVRQARSPAPARDVEGEWVACSPATIDAVKFSAAGYFFGRRLQQELPGAVGLVDATWGGTRIERWIPRGAFAGLPGLADYTATKPGPALAALGVSNLYNGMIAPLAPFALRGVLWYQGESNVADAEEESHYLEKMQALIRGWRGSFQNDLAFYFVQIAPYLYHLQMPGIVSPEAAARLRESQAAAQALPHTGMVVTTDLVDNLLDIHPRNKRDVGERLARWALARDYGHGDLEVSGPVFRSLEISGARAVLRFDHLGGGLMSLHDQPLRWFTVAGPDGKFWPAEAAIEHDTVVVKSARVPHPVTVRFAWDEAAQPNLFNRAGLPAGPFRTDNPYLNLKLKN